jgi:enediyne biosynthesis protein E4
VRINYMKVTLFLALTGVALAFECIAQPVFTRQPTPRTNFVSIGASLTNRVTATTSNGPLAYQWHRNNVLLAHATNSALVLTNLQQSAIYFARATDSVGHMDSAEWVVQVDPTFTKVTSGPVVKVSGFASAWGDYNNDGLADLFIGTITGNPTGTGLNALYRNLGNGEFIAAPATNFPAGTVGISAAWADYNNDGFLDLVVSKTGADLLYRNLGDGTFAKVQNPISTESGVGFATAWGDFNNDGLVDLFVGNETGAPNAVYLNHDAGVFTKMTNASLAVSVFTQGAAVADYDNDGWLDLVVANYFNNKMLLYHNNGSGTLVSITNSPITTSLGEFSACAWGDYDNDGWLDLFVGGYRSGKNSLYQNNRDGTFSKIATSIVSTDPINGKGVWGDYDNDGFLDLLVSRGGGATLLYHNSGDGQFTTAATGSIGVDGSAGRASAWVDIDNDGFLDLWIARTLGELNCLYRNNGNSNSWLIVKLQGRVSNRAAIGAKVRVKARLRGETTWQMRQITGDDLNAHFGLGSATNIETLRIEWPSGIHQEFHDLKPGTPVILVEPSRLTLSRLNGSSLFSLTALGGREVSYLVESSSDLLNWSPFSTTTNSTDFSGFTNSFAAPGALRFFRAQEKSKL